MGLLKSKNNPSVSENLAVSTASGWLKSPKKPQIPRKFMAILMAGVLLALVGAGWYVWSKKADQVARETGCSTELIQASLPYLKDRMKHEQLKPVVERIRQRKKYDSDANCLYILLTYNLHTNDAKAARADFEKLQKVYDSKKGFSPFFSSHTKDIEALQSEVEFAELKAKEREANIQLIGDQPR